MSHDPTDAVAAHQKALAKRPPFTARQERYQALRVLAARRRYCRAALELDHVARTSISFLKRVLEEGAGGLNYERTVHLCASEVVGKAALADTPKEGLKAEAKRALLARVAANLPTAEALLRRGTPAARRKAARLLAELCPRRRKVEQLVREAGREFGADTAVALRRMKVLDRERTRMAEGNLRLVWMVAKRYAGPSHPLEDLLGEGHEGLMKAIDHFDPLRGFKFSTMGTGWIKQAVTRAVGLGRAVKVPSDVQEIASLVHWARAALAEGGGSPGYAEVVAYIKDRRGKTVTAAKAAAADRAVQPVGALADEGGEDVAGQAVADDAEGQEAAAEREAVWAAVRRAVRVLPYKEREILALRFGLGDGWTYTLEECGRVFRVSREMVRKLEGGALAKLRGDGSGLLSGHV
jgi:RNA polymerase primary sigma factor